MDLERVLAILQAVGGARGRSGQLLRFAHWNKPGVQAIGDHGRKNEPASLDPHHAVDELAHVVVGQQVDRPVQPERIFQQRRDVIEENTWLRKIGNFGNQLLKVLHPPCPSASKTKKLPAISYQPSAFQQTSLLMADGLLYHPP